MLIAIPFALTVLYGLSIAFRRPAKFAAFLMAVGSLQFGSELGEGAGGVANLSSLWLLVLIVLSAFAVLQSGAFLERLSLPEKCYLLFLGWCVFEVCRAESVGFAARMFLKLLFPLLVMVLARHAGGVRGECERAMRWTTTAAFVSYLLVGGVTMRFAGSFAWAVAPLFWVGAAFADYTAIMSGLALACWRCFGQHRYLVLACALATSSAFLTVRTGVLATAVGISACLWIEYRWRAIPLIGVAVLGTGALLTMLPEFKSKMFVPGSQVALAGGPVALGQLDVQQIDSSGRFVLWDKVLQRFFRPAPYLGSGLGSTQAWFSAGNETTAKVEHSEYVRLLCDTGLIGLTLYVVSLLACAVTSYRIAREATDAVGLYVAVAAFSAVPAYLVCMGFDNVLNYALPAAQYPMALAGFANGRHWVAAWKGEMPTVVLAGRRV